MLHIPYFLCEKLFIYMMNTTKHDSLHDVLARNSPEYLPSLLHSSVCWMSQIFKNKMIVVLIMICLDRVLKYIYKRPQPPVIVTKLKARLSAKRRIVYPKITFSKFPFTQVDWAKGLVLFNMSITIIYTWPPYHIVIYNVCKSSYRCKDALQWKIKFILKVT